MYSKINLCSHDFVYFCLVDIRCYINFLCEQRKIKNYLQAFPYIQYHLLAPKNSNKQCNINPVINNNPKIVLLLMFLV